jgi:hypothetical protein
MAEQTTRHAIFWSVVLASFLGGILADFAFALWMQMF